MSRVDIDALVVKAHEAGQRAAIDDILSALGRSLGAQILSSLVVKADAPGAEPEHAADDPHAYLLLAQIDHVLRSARAGRDPRPGWRELQKLWHEPEVLAHVVQGAMPADRVEKALRAIMTKAAEHAPKGGISLGGKFFPGGQWIPAQTIAAATDEEKAELAKRRSGADADKKPAKRGAKAPPAPNVPTRDEARKHLATVAADVMTNPKERTPDKYRDLSEAVIAAHERGFLSETDLLALRLRLAAAFNGGKQTVGEKRTVAALLDYAEAAAREARDRAAAPPAPKPQSAASLIGAGTGEPKPGDYRLAALDDLHVDPARFQFKLKTDAAGVTKELANVKQFNPDFAGVVSVWRDPADGKTYVVNGHHRFELARRTGYPHLLVRYLEAKDAREARAKGALVNMAEGRGTALDAAKFLRDSGRGVDDLAAVGVSAESALVRDAGLLTKLNDAAFDRLARGGLDVPTALAVAKHVADPDRQEKLFVIIDKRNAAGKELSPKMVEELARQMAAAPATAVTQPTLWGDETNEEDTFLERADVASHVRNQLSRERHDFHALSSKRRADATSDAGNTLNVEENQKRAAEADAHRTAFDTLAYRKGPVADALDAGAVALKQAKTEKEKQHAREQTAEAVRTALAGAVAGRPADGPGVEAVVPGGGGGGAVEPGAPAPGGPGAAPADGIGPDHQPAGVSSLSLTSPAMAPAPGGAMPPGASWGPGASTARPKPPSRASATSPALAGAPPGAAAAPSWMPGATPPEEPEQLSAPNVRGEEAARRAEEAAALRKAENERLRAEAKPVDNPELHAIAADAIPRKDIQAEGYRATGKSTDMHEHGYTVVHWTKLPEGDEPGKEILEYMPRNAPGEPVTPRLTASNYEEQKAIHEALGAPVVEPGADYSPTKKRGKRATSYQGAPAGPEFHEPAPHELPVDEYVAQQLPKHEGYQNALKGSPHNADVARQFAEKELRDKHAVAVGDALMKDKHVPDYVLADYRKDKAGQKAGTPSVADVVADPTLGATPEPSAPNVTPAAKKPYEMTREELEATNPALHEKILDKFPAYGAGFDSSFGMYLREAMERGLNVPLDIRKKYLGGDSQRLSRTGKLPVEPHEWTSEESAARQAEWDRIRAQEQRGRERAGKPTGVGPEPSAPNVSAGAPSVADVVADPGRFAGGDEAQAAPGRPVLRSDDETARPADQESGDIDRPAPRESVQDALVALAAEQHPPASVPGVHAWATHRYEESDAAQKEFGSADAFASAVVAAHLERNKGTAGKVSAEAAAAGRPDVRGEDGGAAAPELSSPNVAPHVALANTLAERLKAGALEKNELWKHADKHFGGTRAEGKYGPSDAYDALEAGLNKSFAGQTDPTAPLAEAQQQARALEKIVDTLPTQTNRSGNKESHQQFSTPPHYAFAANWVANLRPTDTVLEPSAGTGSLAVHAQNAGVADLHTNEIDPKRADFLKDQFGADRTHVENAEQIAGILPKRGVRPSVVVMNPPFSQTAGRMGDKKDLMTGAKHIAEAGRMLAPGGRLVAIVGGGTARGDASRAAGMSPNAPTYKKWFAQMAKDGFALRANVGVEGGEYKKYGTNFPTRMLVFDKVAPDGTPPVVGDAKDIPDLMAKLEGVRDGRPELAAGAPGEQAGGAVPETSGGEPGGPGAAPVTGTGVAPAGEAGEPAVAGVPGGAEGAGGAAGGGRPGVGDVAAGERVRGAGARGRKPAAGAAAEGAAGAPGAAGAGPEGGPDGGGGGQAAGGKPVHQLAPGIPGLRPAERVAVEPIVSPPAPEPRDGSEESLYETYRPARMKIAGAKPHNTKLVESAAMAAVAPPVPTYRPTLSQDLVEGGLRDVKNPDGTTSKRYIGLSEAGLESVVYAGQSHNSFLQAAEGEDPARRGFFIGDGTGTGKGRQIAGIMIDSANQGRPKHVWISKQDKLFNDAKRDWADMGQDPNDVVHWDKLSGGGFKHKKGVAFVTYTTLKSGPKDLSQPRNVDRLIDWLGKDFDGVIAFDEAHMMGNADDTPGPRGTTKASQTAQAAMKLQRALPKARIVYVSATGATKPENLAYAERLGLWGRGTPFATKGEFLNQMHQGGTSAMEAVAQSLKARGLYLARSLSYDGVKTDRLQHHLTDEQKYVYDNLAEGWQGVLQNINTALEHIAGGKENVRHAGQAKSAAMSQFQGAQQRFFNQVITSMMVPTLIKHMERDIAEGRAPVVQLINTMESATKRAMAERKEGEDLEDLDLSPKQMLIDFLQNSFPVHRLQEVKDENGNVTMKPVTDSHGSPVEDPAAVALRDDLITRAHDLQIPQSPLDQIINHFGHDKVAEATGRTVRLVKKIGDDGVLRLVEERRNAKQANEAEARAFQGGKKNVMVFSEAGGTGASYHADRSAKNQNQRSHYLLQPGWRADTAVQGLGRTHRTNQASAPIFHLMEAPDVPGQKRFVSTIARRLGQLGALTRGQAATSGGTGLFNAADNLESVEAQRGLESFINSMKRGVSVNGQSYTELMGKLGFKVDNDAGGGGGRRVKGQTEVPEMRQFLNRVLALKLADQQEVFRQLDDHIASQIEMAKAAGTLDNGVERFEADQVERKGDDQTVYRDPETGAEGRLVRATATRKAAKRPWEANQKGKLPLKFVRNQRSGRVWGVFDAAPTTDERTGAITPMYTLRGPGGVQHVPQSQVDPQSWRATGYDQIDHNQAKELWDREHAALPDTTQTDEHFVTGDLLSVWDKLPSDRPKIYRVDMPGGSIVGRHVPAHKMDEVLRNLGATATGSGTVAPADALGRVRSGGTARLANGWRLNSAWVQGERRVELHGPVGMHRAQLAQDGVIVEKIAHKERYFIPVGADGAKVLERVTRSRNSPVTEVQ